MSKKQVLSDFKKFVSIKSYSTGDSFSEIQSAVTFLSKLLSSIGCEVTIYEKKGFPPLIVAKLDVNPGSNTIGIYGHYDVQPVNSPQQWETPPHTLTLKSGSFRGRGVADNKGHIIQNIHAISELRKSGTLHNNIVFIFEGEEETGSTNIDSYLTEAKNILSKVDVFYVTDVGMYSKTVPQIYYGLRGFVGFELTVSTAERNLHSGVYGNRVLNSAQVVFDLLSKMKDVHTGEVRIPGFYDNVRTIDKQERELLAKTQVSDTELQKEMNSFGVTGLKGKPAWVSSKIFPSLDVHGVIGGYTKVGLATIIPQSTTVKFSCRLVEHQSAKNIKKLIESFIENQLPKGVKYSLQDLSTDDPFYTSLENEYIQKTAKVLEEHFGSEVVYNRSGGSIPVTVSLQKLFGKPIVLTGFILPGENMHAPNENYDEEMFWEGIEVLKKLYSMRG